MFTEEVKADYLKSGGGHCPYCRSKDISATEPVDMDGDNGGQVIECFECEKRWMDIVSLTDICEY
jgi:hypothetical protein